MNKSSSSEREGNLFYSVSLLFLSLFLFISAFDFVNAADDPYNDCTIFGNCPPAQTVITFNNNTGNVNNSIYWNGLTTSNLSSYVPYVGANKNVNLNNFNLSNVKDINVTGTGSFGTGNTIEGAVLQVKQSSFSGTSADAFRIITEGGGGMYMFAESNVANPQWRLGTFSDEDMSFFIGGTNRIFIDGNNGNVGIGNTTPVSKLQVDNGAIRIRQNSAPQLLLHSTDLSLGDNEAIGGMFWISDDTSGPGTGTTRGVIDLITPVGNFGSRFDMRWRLTSGSGSGTLTELMRLTNTGNLGIAINLPVANLHINSSAVRGILINNPTVGTASTDGTYFGQNGVNFAIINQEVGELNLGTSNTDRLTILSGGNIGIQNSTPSYPLTVSGNGSGDITAWFEKNISATGFISRTNVYDTSKEGSAIAKLKPSSELIKQDGKINYQGFGYSYVNWTVREVISTTITTEQYEECLTEQLCETKEREIKTPIYGNVTYHGVDLVLELAWLRGVAYEQQQIINDLKTRLEVLESK